MNDFSEKKRILIFSDYYLPGYKSGGGMRTIVNIVTSLNSRYDFFIITNDHDGRSDLTPYDNVKLNDWNFVEGAKVFYLSKSNTSFYKILKLIKDIEPDILYSNSYFSVFNIYLLILKRLNKLKTISFIISPCGELSGGALEVSLYKKTLFMFLARLFRVQRGIFWKATHEEEKREIAKLGVPDEKIFIAPDLVSNVRYDKYEQLEKPEKSKGSVKFVFLSRFSEKKNFKFFLEQLKELKGNIAVDIYAPVDVESYWLECLELIKRLPPGIKIEKKEPIPHSKVLETLFKYHFFAMPTLGENFGHVFLEALSAGCPLLISDRTPWQNLEKMKIGWDLPLENVSSWRETIKKCVEMEQTEYTILSSGAKRFAEEWRKQNDMEKRTIELFDKV